MKTQEWGWPYLDKALPYLDSITVQSRDIQISNLSDRPEPKQCEYIYQNVYRSVGNFYISKIVVYG